jgi:hypothetical protein
MLDYEYYGLSKIAELRDSGLLCREASNNNGILIKEANNEFTFLVLVPCLLSVSF